jgi:uncharacterized protein (DUF1501 family)
MERGLNRRTFLQVSTLAVLGARAMPALAEAQTETRRKLLPIIIFFQAGAQSPYEFVSPLSDAPEEIRGPCHCIRASNGIRIGEHWPSFAKVAKETSIVRTIDAENNFHSAYPLFQDNLPIYAERQANGGIPYPFILLRSIFGPHDALHAGDSFQVRWNEGEGRYKPPDIQACPGLKERKGLLEKLNASSSLESSSSVQRWQKNSRTAWSLLLGGELEEPFHRAQKRLERHGDNEVGKATALAVEFAKSGAGVTVIYNEHTTPSGSGWDMHENLKKRTDELAPITDQALTALVEDAHEEGFVLLCTTEHGRTPHINRGAGRDHHMVSYMVGAGGNFAKGVVEGELTCEGGFKTGPIKAGLVMPTTLAAAGVELAPTTPRIRSILK